MSTLKEFREGKQKEFNKIEFYNFLKERNLILYEVIVGSQAYGTALPTSDIDKKFVFCLPEEMVLGLDYVEQIDINKDYVGYEIKRYIELLSTNNPTIIDMMYMPDDCILYMHPAFKILMESRDKFLSKICANSFAGYANEQVQKAHGMNKKMNWKREKFERKEILDFSYVVQDFLSNKFLKPPESKPIKDYLGFYNLNPSLCGISNIPHAKDIHALYYDSLGGTFKYKGLVIDVDDLYTPDKNKTEEENYLELLSFRLKERKSHALRLSSVPKGEKPIAIITFQKDAYAEHCRDFRDYQVWMKNANPQRWVDNQSHMQKIDGKNCLHLTRLIEMGLEIAQGKGVIVRRPNAQELLKIRRGEVDLQTILENADAKIKQMHDAIKKSALPDEVDMELSNNILKQIRKAIY